MTTRGLVLAGGGLAGIAWETGVLRGIQDVAPHVAEALLASEVLLGTSAGSTVAAQISSGTSLETLFATQITEDSREIDPGVAVEQIAALFAEAMTTPEAANTTRAHQLRLVGEIAVATDTVPESVRRGVIANRLPSHEWPDRVLRVPAVDVATGQLVVFDRDARVPLVDAVAASCAVPGAWPPVTIGDRRFIDGGVGSTVNLGAASDCAAVVVLVPSSETAPVWFGEGAVAEIAAFHGDVLSLFADDASVIAFGPNPLDPACRIPSANAGREQGRRDAPRVARFLGLEGPPRASSPPERRTRRRPNR